MSFSRSSIIFMPASFARRILPACTAGIVPFPGKPKPTTSVRQMPAHCLTENNFPAGLTSCRKKILSVLIERKRNASMKERLQRVSGQCSVGKRKGVKQLKMKSREMEKRMYDLTASGQHSV